LRCEGLTFAEIGRHFAPLGFASSRQHIGAWRARQLVFRGERRLRRAWGKVRWKRIEDENGRTT